MRGHKNSQKIIKSIKRHVLLNHIFLYLCRISMKNRKKMYITLYTSLKPPLPSRWSNKYLSFNVGWSLNLKGGEKNTQAHENTHEKVSSTTKLALILLPATSFSATLLLILNSIPYYFSFSNCMTITHLNALVFTKLNIYSRIFRFNDQL